MGVFYGGREAAADSGLLQPAVAINEGLVREILEGEDATDVEFHLDCGTPAYKAGMMAGGYGVSKPAAWAAVYIMRQFVIPLSEAVREVAPDSKLIVSVD